MGSRKRISTTGTSFDSGLSPSAGMLSFHQTNACGRVTPPPQLNAQGLEAVANGRSARVGGAAAEASGRSLRTGCHHGQGFAGGGG